MAASASHQPKAAPVVLGCGAVGADYLATVASFPNPDDKIRSLALKVEGGGNAGNALTGAARLGLNPRIISKVSSYPTSLTSHYHNQPNSSAQYLLPHCSAVYVRSLLALATRVGS
jgi:hypothetical protein